MQKGKGINIDEFPDIHYIYKVNTSPGFRRTACGLTIKMRSSILRTTKVGDTSCPKCKSVLRNNMYKKTSSIDKTTCPKCKESSLTTG